MKRPTSTIERQDGKWSRALAESPQFDRLLKKRLESSEVFDAYKKSFQQAFGIPLHLAMPAELNWLDGNEGASVPLSEGCPCREERGGGAAPVSPESDGRKTARVAAPVHTSFAGIKVTGIPVQVGSRTMAYLVTWRTPGQASGEALAPERFQAAVTLLCCFAEQLSWIAEQLNRVEEGSEPIGIIKARAYIQHHLDEELSLSLVARHAGLSESHFCRLFKEHLGITMTDYISRCRIAWAKRELLRTGLRISEVGFMVGFMSLSQFNRCFARIEGCSPSTYRSERIQEIRKSA